MPDTQLGLIGRVSNPTIFFNMVQLPVQIFHPNPESIFFLNQLEQ